jgi:hypothetical protein
MLSKKARTSLEFPTPTGITHLTKSEAYSTQPSLAASKYNSISDISEEQLIM